MLPEGSLGQQEVADIPSQELESSHVIASSREVQSSRELEEEGGWVLVGGWQPLSLASPEATVKRLQLTIKHVPWLVPLSPICRILAYFFRDLLDVLIQCWMFPWLRRSLLVYTWGLNVSKILSRHESVCPSWGGKNGEAFP